MADYSSLPPKQDICDMSFSDVPESSISPTSSNSSSSGMMYELMQTRKDVEKLKNLVYTGRAQNSPKEGRMTENANEFEFIRPNHEIQRLKEELKKEKYEREKYQKEAQKFWRELQELQTDLDSALAENDRNKHQIKVLTLENENIKRENDCRDRLKKEFDFERDTWKVKFATLEQENSFLQEAAFSGTRDQELENQLENERNMHEKEIQELKMTYRFENRKLEQEIEKLRREKQAVGERSETREVRLMKLEKETEVVKGAGCYYGDDRHVSEGGPRRGFDKEKLQNVLKLVALGGIVNIKLASDEDKNARHEDCQWELEFSAACKENGKGTHRLWLKCRNNSRFHAVVQQIDGKDGVIKDTKVMPSVQDGLRQLFEIKHVGGNNIRFNISTLPSPF